MIIGVDPHKSTHTATAVDAATNTAVASVRVAASAVGYRRLLGWAEQFPERRSQGSEPAQYPVRFRRRVAASGM